MGAGAVEGWPLESLTTRASSLWLDRSEALRTALASFTVTRLVVLAAAWLGVSQLDRFYHRGLFTEGALMWDGAWYAGIARDGYLAVPGPHASNVAFPPLLPLLDHLLGSIFRFVGVDMGDPQWGSWALAGVLISNLAFIIALYLLWQLVSLDHSPSVANRTIWLVAAFPLGVFWSAFYTESLYLLLAVSCILAARKGMWLPAGALAGLAVLARWPAIILGPVLLVEWLSARRRERATAEFEQIREPGSDKVVKGANPSPYRAAAWMAIIPLPLVAYMSYLVARFGDPWIVWQARRALGQGQLSFFLQTYTQGAVLFWQSLQPGPVRDQVLASGEGTSLYMWLDLGMPLLFAGLGVVGWRWKLLRAGDLTLLTLGIVFPLTVSTTVSLARYLIPLWPAMIVGAYICKRRPALERVWFAASFALLAITAYMFANAKWVG